MAYKSFEELEVWKLGCRLAVRIYEVLPLIYEIREKGMELKIGKMVSGKWRINDSEQ
jgi:hypothetical protein